MIPEGATHTDLSGHYVKPDAFAGDYLRWHPDTFKWQYAGQIPRELLNPLPIVQRFEMEKFDVPAPAPAPVDELGKVWDALHEAGVNSGGTLPASEGVKQLAAAKALLLKLFNANEAYANAEHVDPAVSQWNGSPMRDEIETFLGLKPVDPVEAQLQRDELLYGNSYAMRNADGTMTRLDPTLIVIRQRKL